MRASRILVAIALVALLPMAAHASEAWNSDQLTDLQPTTANPTDGAHAIARVRHSTEGSSVAWLILSGLDTGSAGTTLGAHVHEGECVTGLGEAAGAHYNSGAGDPSPETEVWLDFTIRDDGRARAVARVPFQIEEGGAGSIVIHAMATDDNGAAGARIACISLDL